MNGDTFDESPVHVIQLGPTSTFAELSRAIDTLFGHESDMHLHEFRQGGRDLVSMPEFEDYDASIDEAILPVSSLLDPGDTFEYVYDLGDYWRHRCDVLASAARPSTRKGA